MDDGCGSDEPGSLRPEDFPLAGDLIKAAIEKVGADRLARWLEAKTGKPCNCEWRQQALNRVDAKLRKWLGW